MGLELDNLLPQDDVRKNRAENVVLGILIIFLVGIVILTQLFSLSKVDGPSMLGTIKDGDLVICYRAANRFGRGDIVTVPVIRTDPETKTETNVVIIKRVIGVPGDRLLFVSDGEIVSLYLDRGSGFTKAEEKYTYEKYMYERFFGFSEFLSGNYKLFYGDPESIVGDEEEIIALGTDEYFVMGDNRNNSRDSREYGAFKGKTIMGKVTKIYSEGSNGYAFFNMIYKLFIPSGK